MTPKITVDANAGKQDEKPVLPAVLGNWLGMPPALLGMPPAGQNVHLKQKLKIQLKSSLQVWMDKKDREKIDNSIVAQEQEEVKKALDEEQDFKTALNLMFHKAEEDDDGEGDLGRLYSSLYGLARSLQMSVGDARLAKEAFDKVDTDREGLISLDGFHLAAVELLQMINKGEFLQEPEPIATQPQLDPESPASEQSPSSRKARLQSEAPKLERATPTEEAIARVKNMTTFSWRTKDRGPDDPVDLHEFLYWYSLIGFREELMLTEDQCTLRRFARKYGIPADLVDTTKQYFSDSDTRGVGAIDFEQFSCMVHKVMKIKAPQTLPRSRLQYFFSTIDKNASGTVTFEEFLQWWLKNCHLGTDQTVMPFEGFYGQIRRLGPTFEDPPVEVLAASSDAKEDANAGKFNPWADFVRTDTFVQERCASLADKAQKALLQCEGQ